MFDVLVEKLKSFFSSRLLPIIIVYCSLFGVLVYTIFNLQIVEYNNAAGEPITKNTQKREIKSTRGNIYDCNGVLLAYNELSYSVVINDTPNDLSNDEKNKLFHTMIQLIERNGDELDVDFPIQLDKDGNFEFTTTSNTAHKNFLKTAYTYQIEKNTLTDEILNATAEDVFNYLRYGDKGTSMFSISDEYTTEEALKIMSVRYAIFANYPKYEKITVATNVSDETVAAIKENSDYLEGVDIEQDSYRKYNDSIYFSHILGYTGRISSEELEEKLAEGADYTSSDMIGKSGIEKAFEEYLAGTKGSETVTVNNLKKVVSVDSIVEPIAGNDVYLTIDSKLQEAAYHLLENKLAGILIEKIVNSMDYGSKGESASKITIPIYEVYYALINNNIIDISSLNSDDATDLEKSVYSKFSSREKSVINQLDSLLATNSKTTNSASGSTMEEYLSYVYSMLIDSSILVSSDIDRTNQAYVDYTANKISLSEFLQSAISNNWVDLAKLDIGSDYYSTEEIYKKLVQYITKTLKNDETFKKKIYKDLIFSYNLSGREICLLLFDQGVLKYNEEEIAKLSSGVVSPYSFMINKIKSLEITPAQLALDPCSGSVVITDPNTGEVKAMVSYPSYDNNKMANKVDAEYYALLQKDNAKSLLNRAAQSTTAPGSTFKMLTSIAGMMENVITPYEVIYDHTKFTKIKPSPSCWKKTSHGEENVVRALRDSCNYYFYEVGWRLGGGNTASGYDADKALNKLKKYATMFGLDSTTGIEITESQPQISYEDGIRSAIGQGKNAYAPVQLARYVSTLANGGTLYNLTLLDKIEDTNTEKVVDNKPVVAGDLTSINRTYWNTTLEGMYSVVNDGSVKNLFKNLNVKVAGKTGTVQQSVNHPNHALFVSYAPYENPEIAVTVVIPNGYDSANAAEVAAEVYDYYFGSTDLDQILESGANGSAGVSAGD